ASVDTLPAPAVQVALPPYSLGKSHYRQFRIRVRIENLGDIESQNIRLQIPVLSRLDSPYQVIESETFSLEPVEITQEGFYSRSAHFLISGLSPGETASINITYKLVTYPLTANFSAYSGASSSAVEAAFLQPSPNIESSHPEIAARAEQITSGARDDLEKSRAIYQFVRQHMRYDSNAACRNQGALTALREKAGVCEDYAALFVALCRAVDIPARQVNGYADPKGTGQRWDQLTQTFPLRGYRHSWAEFYLAGAGWLPADPTMDISAQDLRYFGCLPYCSHIAQNYHDHSVRIRFQGGRLAATWEEELI
ncbi:MAG TPA: transglutaminase domain-containing protein, partial [Firmicutes bacterium]|nr:transglutaminase domain-containing protein [Bacillota bacterium]